MKIPSVPTIVLASSLTACVVQSAPTQDSPPPSPAPPESEQPAPAERPSSASYSEQPASAERPSPASYEDSQGTEIRFEAGDAAFADRVAGFSEGDPWTKLESEQDTSAAVGPPSFEKPGDGTTIALGCGGSVTLEFTDNELVDGDGADLHVFEAGPKIESFQVEISPDAESWTDVGIVKGQPASVDIASSAAAGAIYRFVRLTDQRSTCSGRWPGADIDAVGTLGATMR